MTTRLPLTRSTGLAAAAIIAVSAIATPSALAEAGTDPPPAVSTPSQKSTFHIDGVDAASGAPHGILRTGRAIAIVVKRVTGPIAADAAIEVDVSGDGVRTSTSTTLGNPVEVTPSRAGLLRVRVSFADRGRRIQRSFRVIRAAR